MSHSVVLVNPDSFIAADPAIRAAAVSARPMLASPFYFVDPDDPGLARVASVPGVVAVTVVDDDIAGIIVGVDRIITGIVGLLKDWDVGGVPLGGAYPSEEGSCVGLTAPVALCAAVNISLVPPDDDVAPTLPTDVVNFATRALAAHAVPVVAAGNHHRRGAEFETVSPWAEPEWVLAVGATNDETGMAEWDHSARGTLTNPAVGPDVLTWGQDLLSQDWFGTSFAAARISGMVAVTAALLATVRANLDRIRGRDYGVPLVGVAVIDRGFDAPHRVRPRVDLGALPVYGVTHDAFTGTNPALLGELAKALERPTIPSAARVLVQTAAVATSKAVGTSAPSLTRAQLISWLSRLDVLTLCGLLGLPVAAAPTGPAMFDTVTVERLWTAVEDTMPLWQWNIVTLELSTRPAQEPK